LLLGNPPALPGGYLSLTFAGVCETLCGQLKICKRKGFRMDGTQRKERQIARTFLGMKKNFTGQHFWARGYFVSTVGRDEQMIRKYIKKQETEDCRLDQLNMFE
jgi:hypothetical protein